jgi:hypothetical protein
MRRKQISWSSIGETEFHSQARNAVLLSHISVDETIGRKCASWHQNVRVDNVKLDSLEWAHWPPSRLWKARGFSSSDLRMSMCSTSSWTFMIRRKSSKRFYCSTRHSAE